MLNELYKVANISLPAPLNLLRQSDVFLSGPIKSICKTIYKGATGDSHSMSIRGRPTPLSYGKDSSVLIATLGLQLLSGTGHSCFTQFLTFKGRGILFGYLFWELSVC